MFMWTCLQPGVGEIVHTEPGAASPQQHRHIEDVGFDAKEEEDYHPDVEVCSYLTASCFIYISSGDQHYPQNFHCYISTTNWPKHAFFLYGAMNGNQCHLDMWLCVRFIVVSLIVVWLYGVIETQPGNESLKF